MSIKIIGAGYGRTGTKSLKMALEKLGYGKCYHMEELFRNPSGIAHWKNAYEKQKVDWEALFKNYQSIVDFPGAIYYKEIANAFPDTKVILSVRDPEAWYQSVRSTIYGFDPGSAIKLKMLFKMPFSETARNLFQVIMQSNKAIWDNYFEGKFDNKNYAIRRFHQHIEEVKKVIPKQQLLIFEAKDGWNPLCKFLGKEIPSEPYPNSNKKADFHTWAKGIVLDVLK